MCAAGDDAGPAPGDAWRKAARRWPQAPTAGLRLDPVTAQLLDEAKHTRAPKQRTTPLPVVEQTDLTAVAASTTPALAAPATAAAGAQVMVILMGIPGSGECVSASQLRVVLPLALGFGKPPLESRAKAAARLDLEVSAGWVSPSSRGVMGGAMLCLLNVAAFHSQVRPQTLDVHINFIT